ncbi:MAG: hypothetical protein KA175_13220 [Flavobacteriales bacterium]|nr:hypothetical protein [Flavobacteriales bacterium]MBP6698574.1 hypothetical protein [Flavobacteriales bacterium]
MRTTWLVLLLGVLCLPSCYKDDIDVAALNNNPFDADYSGAAIFTFEEVVNEPQPVPPGGTAQYVVFRVNSSLFLESTSYQVKVRDLVTGDEDLVGQVPVGSDVLRYQRDTVQFGTGEVCLELRLSNNLSYGRSETICGPL